MPAVLSANCRAILSGAWRWLVSFVGASGFALALARAMSAERMQSSSLHRSRARTCWPAVPRHGRWIRCLGAGSLACNPGHRPGHPAGSCVGSDRSAQIGSLRASSRDGAMGIGFAAIAVAAWHAILAIGSAIQRGAVWALVVALKASAHAGSRQRVPWALDSSSWGWQPGTRSWRSDSAIRRAVTWSVTVAPAKVGAGAAAGAKAGWLACRAVAGIAGNSMRRAALSLLGAARWLVVVLPPAAYRGLVRTLVATGHRLMAAGRAAWLALASAGRAVAHALATAAIWIGRAIAWPVVVAAPAVARACLSGAGAIQHGLRRIASVGARGSVRLVRVGLPSVARALVADVRAAGRGFVTLMLRVAVLVGAARSAARGVIWAGAVGIPAAGPRSLWVYERLGLVWPRAYRAPPTLALRC